MGSSPNLVWEPVGRQGTPGKNTGLIGALEVLAVWGSAALAGRRQGAPRIFPNSARMAPKLGAEARMGVG